MVNHSKSFHIALGASFAEYVIEWLFFPSLKGHAFVYLNISNNIIAGILILN